MKAFGFVRGSDLVLCVLSAKKLTGPLVCELSLLNSGTGAVFRRLEGLRAARALTMLPLKQSKDCAPATEAKRWRKCGLRSKRHCQRRTLPSHP